MNFLYILLAVLFFGILIFIHELGHFIAARLCGVKILEFAIGMGPRLFSKKSKKSGTAYSIRLFPIGGFVSMLGENGMELAQGGTPDESVPASQAEQSGAADSFFLNDTEKQQEEGQPPQPQPLDPELEQQAYCNKSVWKRILISLAGPAMNLILGFLLMFLLVFLTRNQIGTTVIAEFNEGSISQNYGLCVGDEIIKVGKVSVHTLDELYYEIAIQGYEKVNLTVKRGTEKITLENVVFPTVAEGGVPFGSQDFKVYAVGDRLNAGTIVKFAFWRSCSMVKMVYDSLAGLLTRRYGVEAVSGPIGITEVITNAAKTGFLTLLNLLILISVNLGVMNLLPLPALDGGHILLYLIEAIRRKPIKQEVEGMINFIGLVIFLALAVVIAIKDIIAL